MIVPKAIDDVLASFDARIDIFTAHEVHQSICNAMPRETVADQELSGWLAEKTAFAFSTHETQNGGPWETYFQPLGSSPTIDGGESHSPDLREVDEERILYWERRARTAKHPTLVARYADLVWDFKRKVTRSSPQLDFAHLAIDSYLSELRLDDGKGRGEGRRHCERALQLCLMIRDSGRTDACVAALIDFVGRTSRVDKIGTYMFLFDLLLVPRKGLRLASAQESSLIAMFEERFETLSAPGWAKDIDPFPCESIGSRLGELYRRRGETEKRFQVFARIGRAFERRARIGDAISSLSFLEKARQHLLQAGAKEEAERLTRELQEVAPRAQEQLKSNAIAIQLGAEDRSQFLCAFQGLSTQDSLEYIAARFIVSQSQVMEDAEQRDREFPIQALFASTIISDAGIKAHVDDEDGDPDGPMAWETARQATFMSPFLGWALDHVFEQGATAGDVIEFVEKSPLYEADRLQLIDQGIRAHIDRDYVQAVHIIVPQIERAVVTLAFLLGGTSIKAHRSGRGAFQAKTLNDVLVEPMVRKVMGEDLAIYLVATLSHPKGMNIRNEVCHGLLSPARFHRRLSDRVLHVLLAVSLLRAAPSPDL